MRHGRHESWPMQCAVGGDVMTAAASSSHVLFQLLLPLLLLACLLACIHWWRWSAASVRWCDGKRE